jgi:hydrogenase nickel incorporation protein HypA/HybF
VPGALAFAFELLAPGVELEIVEIPARGACRACGAETALPAFPLCCEWCGSTAVDVVRGEELSVESLEVDVEEPLAMTGRAEP